jgi:poly-gamma-glutamate capsule biosynthesis protein CapA/YwtB (metallophosphatase superfamily)
MLRAAVTARRFLAGLAVATLAASTQPARAAGDEVTIVVVGDVGLNPGRQTVDPRGIFKHGFQPWADTLSKIGSEINGDLNFMNLETVITDRNDLPVDSKGQQHPYNFRTHPNGLKFLVSRGFNLISLANNHSMDFGVPGLKETLKHVGALRGHGILAASGIGMNRDEASRTQVIHLKDDTIAFNAMGIVTNNLARHRAGPDKPGQIAYRFDDDFHLVLKHLTAQKANYRILSIHYGYEGKVRADSLELKQWRGEAALRDGIDLIIGHHAHVVRGVEIAGHSLIFYGLGNFLHHGTANMTHNDICRNYGLMARIHLRKGADGKLVLRAVEAIPVTDTHFRPRRLPPAESAKRLYALNYLGSTLDDPEGQAHGVRFTPQRDGTGLFCLPGAGKDPGRIGALCRHYAPAPPIPASMRAQIAASCAR